MYFRLTMATYLVMSMTIPNCDDVMDELDGPKDCDICTACHELRKVRI